MQKNGRYRKGVEREHFVVAVEQMESSQMSRSVSRIRAAYRTLRDYRTGIRAGRNLAAMEDALRISASAGRKFTTPLPTVEERSSRRSWPPHSFNHHNVPE